MTGIFLTAAMLAGTLGAGTAQEVVKAAGSTIKASGGQIKLKDVTDDGVFNQYSVTKTKKMNIKIVVPKESTVFLDFYGVRGDENDNAYLKKNWTISFQGQKWTGRAVRIVKHLKKGTYTLTGSISEPQFSVIDAGYVDPGSSRFTSAKNKIKEGTGKWNYQTFKVKKKSHIQTVGRTFKYKSGIIKAGNNSHLSEAYKKISSLLYSEERQKRKIYSGNKQNELYIKKNKQTLCIESGNLPSEDKDSERICVTVYVRGYGI